jgi:glutaredoxin
MSIEAVVYTSKNCVNCRMAKTFLEAAGARVREEPATGEDGEPTPRVREIIDSGVGRSLPIVVIGGRALSGFDPLAFENAIARASGRA